MTTTTGTVLQLNWGSHARVKIVYAYDPFEQVALVRLAPEWGDVGRIDRVDLKELEAVRNGQYVDVELVVRQRARELV